MRKISKRSRKWKTSNLRIKKMTMILKNLEISEAPTDPLIRPMTKKVTFAKCTYQKFKAIITKR
jgi:hypothetical protein